MTMQEWPDDKLNEFFRKASEELNPQFEADDWSRMKKRLNQEDRHVDIWTRFKSLFIVLGALLLITGIWLFNSDTPVPVKNSKSDNATTAKTNPLKEVTTVGREDTRITEQLGVSLNINKTKSGLGEHQLKNRTILNNNLQRIATDEIFEDGKTKQFFLSDSEADTTGVMENQRILSRHSSEAGGVHSDPIRNESSERYGGTTLIEQRISVTDSNDRHADLQAPVVPFYEPNLNDKKVNSLLDTLVIVNDAINNSDSTTVQAILPEESKEGTGKLENIFWQRLAIRAGISPEINAVKLADFSALSMTANVMIEYQLLPRTYVQAGVVRSSKTYSAFPGDYSWPERWKQPVLPVSVDGTCDILEVPLNIRYNLIEGEKMNWFLTGGVSNYRMLNEKYIYNYERPDPAIRWYEWEGNTGWYWASHINFSAGVERKLGKRFSVFAEPNIKVPVKKVGLGKINLYSTGIWFSVKYNLR